MAENFHCKWCGQKYPSVMALINGSCSKSPSNKHELYEGSEKSQYTCKYCGQKYPSLISLTNGSCSKSPNKRHQSAL
jgi:hypothetical protein